MPHRAFPLVFFFPPSVILALSPSVILSEAKDLLFQTLGCPNDEIPRYARNDRRGAGIVNVH